MVIDDCKVIYRGSRTSGIIVAENETRRDLYLEGNTLQSCMLLSDPNELYLEYSQAMMSVLLFQPTPGKVLIIGLGGGSLVKFLLELCTEAKVDVVEINPEVIKVAHQYFLLPESERLRIIAAPGEEIVVDRLASAGRYDLVLVDAFDDKGPARALLEKHFLRNCRKILSENGLFAMNLWNRPTDNFLTHLDVLSETFAQHVYKLILSNANRNGIVFGFRRYLQPENLMELKHVAKSLSRRTGINFLSWLRQLYWQNI